MNKNIVEEYEAIEDGKEGNLFYELYKRFYEADLRTRVSRANECLEQMHRLPYGLSLDASYQILRKNGLVFNQNKMARALKMLRDGAVEINLRRVLVGLEPRKLNNEEDINKK